MRRKWISSANRTWSTAEVFSEINREKQWVSDGNVCSGVGSRAKDIVAPYRCLLRSKLNDFGLESPKIVDIGCGDFYIGAKIAGLCNYTGVNVVPDLINHHAKNYSSESVSFQRLNAVEDELPHGDVVLMPQVLTHLLNEQLLKIVKKPRLYQRAFTTEHHPADDVSVIPNIGKVQGSDVRIFENLGVFLSTPTFNDFGFDIEVVLDIDAPSLGTRLKRGVIPSHELMRQAS